MNNKRDLSVEQIKYIAKLANLTIKEDEVIKLRSDLAATLDFIEKVKKVDTKGIKPTSNVTGLTNVFREDIIFKSFSQKEALSEAKRTHEGYFKVNSVLEK